MQFVRSSFVVLALGLAVSGAMAGDLTGSSMLSVGAIDASQGHDNGDGSSSMGQALAARPMPMPRPRPFPYPYPYPYPTPLPKPLPPIPPTGPIH